MNYLKSTDSFPSCNNRTQDTCYFYLPASGKIRAVVQLSHGMCEYVERYEELADFLCAEGIAFCGHDHPGHGRSAPSESELGFMDEKNGAELLVADLRRMNLLIQKKFPDTPVFLLGHSMGSFVARAYLSRYAGELAGAVICGTSGGQFGISAGILLAKCTVGIKGSHYRSKFLNNLSVGSYNRQFGKNPESPAEWLTRNRNTITRYCDDPWCSFIFTAAGFRDLFTLLSTVSRRSWAGTVPPELPLYLISGSKDPVGANGKGVRKVAKRLIQAGVFNISLRLYPDDRHEIFNELDRKTVYSDLLGWLNTRLPQQSHSC